MLKIAKNTRYQNKRPKNFRKKGICQLLISAALLAQESVKKSLGGRIPHRPYGKAHFSDAATNKCLKNRKKNHREKSQNAL